MTTYYQYLHHSTPMMLQVLYSRLPAQNLMPHSKSEPKDFNSDDFIAQSSTTATTEDDVSVALWCWAYLNYSWSYFHRYRLFQQFLSFRSSNQTLGIASCDWNMPVISLCCY